MTRPPAPALAVGRAPLAAVPPDYAWVGDMAAGLTTWDARDAKVRDVREFLRSVDKR